jgi:hypothetical protein
LHTVLSDAVVLSDREVLTVDEDQKCFILKRCSVDVENAPGFDKFPVRLLQSHEPDGFTPSSRAQLVKRFHDLHTAMPLREPS